MKDQSFPDTWQISLSELRSSEQGTQWEMSWKKFLDLYNQPFRAMCSNSYRFHTGGKEPTDLIIEEIVATVVSDFCTKSQFNYVLEKGRLRGFLKSLCNARVVDYLRKQKKLIFYGVLSDLDENVGGIQPADNDLNEIEQLRLSLLSALLEDVRKRVSKQQYSIFELVKIKNVPVDQVANELGVKRGVVDNTVYRVMSVLRDLASRCESEIK